jgi:hypothetical protein
MSQPMEQQVRKPEEEESAQTQWSFSVDLTTTATFDSTAYKVITGGATINLNQSGNSPYTGTMQFNYPVMEGQPGSSQGQIAWTQRTFPLADATYADGILTFTVPTAVPAFLDNFDGNTGAPIPPAPAGPSTGTFKFSGTWDGSSETITNGQAWVPPGWLEDCVGPIFQGPPPPKSASETDPGEGGEGGGDDPPDATWTSGGG